MRCRRGYVSRHDYLSFYIVHVRVALSELSGSERAAKRPSLPRLLPIRHDSATYYVPNNRSHGELGRFTAA